MGGECNYLLRVRPHDKRLEFVPDNEWKTPTMQSWKEEDITALLDEGEAMLQVCIKEIGSHAQAKGNTRLQVHAGWGLGHSDVSSGCSLALSLSGSRFRCRPSTTTASGGLPLLPLSKTLLR